MLEESSFLTGLEASFTRILFQIHQVAMVGGGGWGVEPTQLFTSHFSLIHYL
jgi:hypothetical protein